MKKKETLLVRQERNSIVSVKQRRYTSVNEIILQNALKGCARKMRNERTYQTKAKQKKKVVH